MKPVALAIFLGFVASPVSADAPDAAAEQRKELEGAWTVTGTKGFPKDVPQKDLQELMLIFKGDRVLARYGDKTAEARFKLILTMAGPSQIDVTVSRGPEAVNGKTFKGIYLLEDRTLKISYRDPGKARPSTFTDEGEAGVYTISLKKMKQ
jgi:uncharacterized protein (TIGR03067 family)